MIRRLVTLAFAFGLLIRLAAFVGTTGLGIPIADEKDYSRLSVNILQGAGFSWDAAHPTSLRPPLYPAMVAGIWSVAGVHNFQAVRSVQIVLALAAAWLLYLLGARVFSTEAGLVSAAIYWLYPSLIFFNFTILTETLFTFLLIGFVLLTVLLLREQRAWMALSCGATLALAALTRSVLWPVPVLLCPLMFVLIGGSPTRRATLAGLILVGYVVVIAPWAARNTRLQGGLTIVDTMGGVNLRSGNYEFTPDDRMWDAVSQTGPRNWAYQFYQEHKGESVTEGQRDKWGQRQAVEYMLAHKAQTARRSFIKFADFWGLEREYMAGIQQGLFAPPAWVASTAPILIVLAYIAVVTLGVTGMWLSSPRWPQHVVLLLPLAVITGVHTLAFAHSRYHIPLMPIFCIYAAALLTQGPGRQRGNRGLLAGATACLIILAVIWGRQVFIVDAARIRAFF